MKFTIGFNAFSQMLSDVKPAVPTRPALPVLLSVRVDAKENVQITGTNLDLTANARSLPGEAEIEREGSALLPFKSLEKALGMFDIPKKEDAQLSIDVTSETETYISHEQTRISLPTQTVDDFPVILTAEEIQKEASASFQIPGDAVRTLFDHLVPICSKDETRPALNGIYLSNTFADQVTDQLTVCATNGHMLHWQRLALDCGKEEFGIILPKNHAQVLAKKYKGGSYSFWLRQEGKYLLIQTGDKRPVYITSRLVDSSYPEVQNAFRKTDNDALLGLMREDLRGVIDFARKICKNSSGYVLKLHAETEDTLHVSIEEESESMVARKTFPCTWTGRENFEFGVDPYYIHLFERTLGEAYTVTLSVVHNQYGCIYFLSREEPIGGVKVNRHVRLLMPVRITEELISAKEEAEEMPSKVAETVEG